MLSWILAGILISLLGYAVDYTNKKWSGTFTIGNTLIFYKLVRDHQHIIKNIKLGVKTDANFKFELRHETATDKFFKNVGLSKEQQIGCDYFDQYLYIISDDPRLKAILKYKNEARDAMYSLFINAIEDIYRIQKIECNGSYVLIEIEPEIKEKNIAVEKIKELAELTIPQLQILHQSLKNMSGDRRRVYDYKIFPASLLTGISVGSLSGAIQNYMFDDTVFPALINMGLLKDATFYGITFTCLLLMIWFRTLIGTSRAHLVFMHIIFAGSIGSVGSIFFQLKHYNVEFDKNHPAISAAHVVEKFSERCELLYKETCYYVKVDSKSPYLAKHKFKIPYAFYKTIKKNDHVDITVHAGALQHAWVSSIVKTTSSITK